MNSAPMKSSEADKPRTQAGKVLWRALLAVKGIHWTAACIAFCLAVTLWYTVTVRDKVDTWVDVSVQFKGAPANLVISEGLINKLAVLVRAARGLSGSLTGREASMVVNLSSITKGGNAIAITRDMLPFTSAYEVVETSPSRILVVADTMATREIALGYRIEGKLAPDFFVKTLRLQPQKVMVNGAESQIAAISRISVPVPLAPAMRKGGNVLSVAVPMPANISVSPPQVAIALELGIRTKWVTLERNVVAAGNSGGSGFAVTPEKVTVIAEVPESLAKDQAALAAITATVLPPQDGRNDGRPLFVAVNLPEHAELVSVTPAAVNFASPER